MTTGLDNRAVRFPATGHIWLPRNGHRAAAAGVSLHSPCRPTRVFAQRLLYLGVRLVGSRLVPGERSEWTPPMPEQDWEHLVRTWRDHAGPFDAVAVYHRPQPGRTGLSALLLNNGRGVAFARYQGQGERVAHEFEVLTALAAAGTRSFRVAKPIAFGRHGDGSWLLSTSLPNYPLGAVRDARTRERVIAEIGTALAGRLPRPDGTPDHWVPAHGDLAPWNLRTDLSGTVLVIDWEDAAWAPPGVDALYGALTAHTTFGTAVPERATPEAREWVGSLLRARTTAPGRAATGIDAALLAALQTVRAATDDQEDA